MPKRKYDTQQQAELDLLAAIHEEKVMGRAVIRRRIEAELRDALNDLELKESAQANKCMALKVTKTDIGRAVGTANFDSINAMLARTSLDVAPERFIDEVTRFTFSRSEDGHDNIIVKVNMAGQDWDDYVKSITHTFRFGKDLSDMHEGEYMVSKGTAAVIGVVQSPLAGRDNTTAGKADNPVTMWVRFGPGAAELKTAYLAWRDATDPIGLAADAEPQEEEWDAA